MELVTFQYREADEHNPHGFVGAVYRCRVTGGSLTGSHESESLEYRRLERVPEWHKDHERAARDALDQWEERTGRGDR